MGYLHKIFLFFLRKGKSGSGKSFYKQIVDKEKSDEINLSE